MITHEKNASENGFTLIEMAFVMVLSAAIFTAGFQYYNLYTKDRLLRLSQERQELISTSLSRYTSAGNNLPCPADPSLPMDDPNYGFEDCSLRGALVAVGTCTGPGNTGICKVAGGRDTEFDGDTDMDAVLVGMVPFMTVKLGMGGGLATFDDVGVTTVLDAWGYPMTYAVSEALTTSNQSSYGAIDMRTEDGVALTDPASSTHYALIAHGANHAGAYNEQGVIPQPCIAGQDETENCDGDGTFVVGLRSTQPGAADYFDDVVYHTSFTMNTIWEFEQNTSNIINKNIGKVGIGTANPTQRLEVNGDIRGNEFYQGQLCDTAGLNCWPTSNLTSAAGTQCPAQATAAAGNMWVVKEVVNAQVVCEEVPMIQPAIAQTCPGGEYVMGFDSTGLIMCGTP